MAAALTMHEGIMIPTGHFPVATKFIFTELHWRGSNEQVGHVVLAVLLFFLGWC